MKIAFLFFSFLLPQAQGGVPQAGQKIHVVTDENHCNANFYEQQRLAIRDLLSRAELECGANLVPIQISGTELIESHSCVHYRFGVTASATFRCDILSPEDQRTITY